MVLTISQIYCYWGGREKLKKAAGQNVSYSQLKFINVSAILEFIYIYFELSINPSYFKHKLIFLWPFFMFLMLTDIAVLGTVQKLWMNVTVEN